MGDRLVGFEPGLTVSIPRQQTARSRDVRDGVIRETQALRRCQPDKKCAKNGDQAEG